MFIAELNHPNFKEFDLSSLRTGIMGIFIRKIKLYKSFNFFKKAGSVCPTATMKDVQEKMHMKEITIAYGMTETYNKKS